MIDDTYGRTVGFILFLLSHFVTVCIINDMNKYQRVTLKEVEHLAVYTVGTYLNQSQF